MAGFKFRLRGLLHLRQAVEKDMRRQLMEAQSLCKAKEQEIVMAVERIGEWSDYYNDVLANRFNAVELAVIDRHIQRLGRLKEQLEIGLEVLNRKKEDLIKQYGEARRQVKTLQHLRDSRHREYLLEQNRLDGKIADEMAVLRFRREEAVA